MVRLTKIYTRQGDGGTTRLASGEEVAKSSPRLDLTGELDELNSHIGVLRTAARAAADERVRAEAESALRRIQNDLFDLGAAVSLATGEIRHLSDDNVAFLEERIDYYQELLEPLPSFVLPGGGTLSAYAHVARAMCRRVERVAWRLHDQETLEALQLKYLNRLSDYLFVFARWVARFAGEAEPLWGE